LGSIAENFADIAAGFLGVTKAFPDVRQRFLYLPGECGRGLSGVTKVTKGFFNVRKRFPKQENERLTVLGGWRRCGSGCARTINLSVILGKVSTTLENACVMPFLGGTVSKWD
jgi:hypothetical protein